MGEDTFVFSDRGWVFPPIVATLALFVQTSLFLATGGSSLVILLGILSYLVFTHMVPLEFRKSMKYDIWPMVGCVQFWLAYSTFMGETLTWNSYLTKILSIFVCAAVSVSYATDTMTTRKKASMLIMLAVFFVNLLFPSKEIFVENMFVRFMLIRVVLYCGTHFVVTAWQRSGPIMSNEVNAAPVFYECLRNFQTLWILFGWNLTSGFLSVAAFIIMAKRVDNVVRRPDHRN